MTNLVLGFIRTKPQQYKKLVRTEKWLLSKETGGEENDATRENLLSHAKTSFDSLKKEFLYIADPFGPWTLRKQKKTLSDGIVLVGDCDGFAVECLRRCKDIGVSAHRFRLIVCVTETNEAHMVSSLETDQGSVVFDCRAEALTDIDRLLDKGYRFKIASSPKGTWHQVFNRRE